LIPRPVLVRTLIVLALTQLIGWGTVGLVAIVGRQMADDLGMSVTAVFAGNSVLYLGMGLCAPLMLATGLSSSLFWPIASFVSHAVGWRSTCLIYAAGLALLSLPLLIFGLPRRAPSPAAPGVADRGAPPTAPASGTFWLIVAAIALNAFITYGFSAILIELLKAEGLRPDAAVAFGSILGIIQVSARGIDFLGGGRWDGVATGLFAGVALPVALAILIVGAGAYWSVAAFIVLYGLGSGALAVARATIPLVFYDKVAFTKATSHIALPLNVISALAPPSLAALLTHSGCDAVLGFAILCSCSALAMLFILGRRRPRHHPA
jgi:hypothetical protein